MQFWRTAISSKKTPTQRLYCEIWKLFKNYYFEDYLWMSASKLYLKRDSSTGFFPCILGIIHEHLFCRGSTNGWSWNTSAVFIFSKVASLTVWTDLTVLETEPSTSIFSEFWEKIRKGKLFCTIPPSNHFSDDVVSFSFLQISDVCCLNLISLMEKW